MERHTQIGHDILSESGSELLDLAAEIALTHHEQWTGGGYPQRHGDRLGAEVEFQMREGSRDRLRAHASISAVDASAVAEGPLGRGSRGSWLVSARKSYLDLVLKRMYEDQTVNFGFTDVQGKLTWDLTSHHRLEWSATGGRSRLDLVPDEITNPNDLRDAMSESGVSVLAWRYLPSPSFALTQRVAVAANTFRNTARDGPVLDDGATRDLIYRAEWTRPVGARLTLDGGAEARWTQASASEQRQSGTRLVLRERFDDGSRRSGAWTSAHLRTGGLSFEPGVRIDHWTLTGTTALSPWLQSRVPIGAGLSLRAAGGLYRQAPATAEVAGVRLFALDGRQVAYFEPSAGQRYSVADQPAGTYIVALLAKNGKVFQAVEVRKQ